MASHDPNELWPKLDELGLEEVQKRLAQGVYGERKKPVVAQWIEKENAALEAPTYMYHPKEAPNGKIFSAKEVPELKKNGWFDSPAKFPNTEHRDRVIGFLLKEWKWIIGTILVIVGLVIAVLKL